MATWPSDVPYDAESGSFSETIEDTRAKFTPDAGGPPLLRRRQTVSNTTITFDTGPITTSQWSSLWAFYLANSASVFTMTHPDPGISQTNFQFEQPPQRKHMDGLLYNATINLRLRP